MPQQDVTLSGFQFRRATVEIIQVFNSGSYLMAEYNERTGKTSWLRLLLAGQRDVIERWLSQHYPIQAPAAVKPTKVRSKSAASSTRTHRKRSRRCLVEQRQGTLLRESGKPHHGGRL